MGDYFVGYDDWLKQSNYDELAKNFVTSHKELFQAKKIISIGCGQGEIDLHIIDTVSPSSYTGVEPAKNMLSKFQHKFEERKKVGELQGLEFQFFNQKFEDYTTQEKFDLAIMWQCIYYMDLKTAVAKALEIAPKLIFVITSPHSDFQKFSFALAQAKLLIDSADVFETFKGTEYEVTRIGPLSTRVQVTPLSDGLLEFFTHKKPDANARETAEKFLSENHKDGILYDHTEALCITKKN